MNLRQSIFSISGSLVLVGSVFAIYSYLVVRAWGWPDAATFGDSFGALSCIISALGFIGVLAALHMQRSQIHSDNLQTRSAVQLQLLTAYLMCDAVAPADKARIARILEDAMEKITPELVAELTNNK